MPQPAGETTSSGEEITFPSSPGIGLIRNGSFNNPQAKPTPREIPGAAAPDIKPGRAIKSPKI